MGNITIPKIEYLRLKRQADAYKKLSGRFFESVVKDSADEVVRDFRKTDLYTKEFLADLGDGLKKSSFVRK